MLIKIEKLHKSIGIKDLFEDLSFNIEEGEKFALIGRNGLGKTTLFKIIHGEDKEFKGKVEIQKGLKIVLTRQEHFLEEGITPLEYVLNDVPNYTHLLKIIKNYEKNPDHEIEKIQEYTDAINEFSFHKYFNIEDKIIESLKDFQINEEMALESMHRLSGGEKRFVELVRVMYSNADIALIDEPTNHMDYVGKAKFIEWMNNYKKTLFIITHDRDVLNNVHKILELKNKKILSFKGNYDHYIAQNSIGTVTQIDSYETGLKNLDKAKKQMLEARRSKGKAKSDSGRSAAKIREERFQKEMDRLENELDKPSFWIDQESLEQISDRVVDKYNKYKEKNIRITNSGAHEHKKLLMKINRLSIGYDHPLFDNIHLEIFHGDRIFIKGRNGAGKSTLVRTIISLCREQEPKAKIYFGEMKFSPNIRLGIYEQEVDKKYLDMTLGEAIARVYYDLDMPVNEKVVNNVLGQYLFNPLTDAKLSFGNLSGGQKARFQIIKMLANNPNLLILDEPTNHLDLPSIEELENALLNFNGGVIYISHDNYLIEKLAGQVISLS